MPSNPPLSVSPFLSTLSLRRATPTRSRPTGATLLFYPRSPCGERPGTAHGGPFGADIFYPRSPCGERHCTKGMDRSQATFLSTLSLRRATCARQHRGAVRQFSIHALLAESDRLWSLRSMIEMFFYPRSPCGERRLVHITIDYRTNFSIHALLAESDWQEGCRETPTTFFYPRSPCGERHDRGMDLNSPVHFSIHALLAESDIRILCRLHP